MIISAFMFYGFCLEDEISQGKKKKMICHISVFNSYPSLQIIPDKGQFLDCKLFRQGLSYCMFV